jgi:hypothetical protein
LLGIVFDDAIPNEVRIDELEEHLRSEVLLAQAAGLSVPENERQTQKDESWPYQPILVGYLGLSWSVTSVALRRKVLRHELCP